MTILIDTDAFCKLAMCNLLGRSLTLLQSEHRNCKRLPALPHMLRRGRIRKLYGATACDRVLPIANSLSEIEPANDDWLEKLIPISGVDPGEAQILATAADQELLVLTGDKRAVRAVRQVTGLTDALNGKIVFVEALLLAHCRTLGIGEVRKLTAPIHPVDKTIGICFSEHNSDPIAGLRSYFADLTDGIKPIQPWMPPEPDKT